MHHHGHEQCDTEEFKLPHRHQDHHLGTGTYDPKRYWSARARAGDGDIFRSVCGYTLTARENLAMHKLQIVLLQRALRTLDISGTHALELGCGVGRLEPWFRARVASYTGCDISEAMVAHARSTSPRSTFLTSDPTQLPFSKDAFDLAFTVTVLHHNPYDHQLRLIAELLRVLRPGGYLLLMEGVQATDHFNMYTRAPADWISSVTAHPGVELRRFLPARWWILRDLAVAPVPLRRDVLGGAPSSHAGTSPRRTVTLTRPAAMRSLASHLYSLLIRAGEVVDPLLLHFLPRHFATNATVLFRKTS